MKNRVRDLLFRVPLALPTGLDSYTRALDAGRAADLRLHCTEWERQGCGHDDEVRWDNVEWG